MYLKTFIKNYKLLNFYDIIIPEDFILKTKKEIYYFYENSITKDDNNIETNIVFGENVVKSLFISEERIKITYRESLDENPFLKNQSTEIEVKLLNVKRIEGTIQLKITSKYKSFDFLYVGTKENYNQIKNLILKIKTNLNDGLEEKLLEQEIYRMDKSQVMIYTKRLGNKAERDFKQYKNYLESIYNPINDSYALMIDIWVYNNDPNKIQNAINFLKNFFPYYPFDLKEKLVWEDIAIFTEKLTNLMNKYKDNEELTFTIGYDTAGNYGAFGILEKDKYYSFIGF